MVNYPARLLLALTPTPLQLLSRISREAGGPRIWIKRDDLTGALLSGNKVRKLEFVLAHALAQGCDTIITCGGLQSNHCRATAVLCAQLGLKCRLILRAVPQSPLDKQSSSDKQSPPDGNLLLDYLVGADVRTFPVDIYQKNLLRLLREAEDELRKAGRIPFVIPTGASDGIGLWGYVAACEELRADFLRHQIEPKHIVCATGSGGTQAGLTAGVELHAIDAKVWGFAVCDDENYFQHKVRADLRDWKKLWSPTVDVEQLSIHVIDDYVGPGYANADAEVFDTIARVAKSEGIVLDPVYTGKAFHGMLSEIARGRFDDSADIVFVHTGGVFGLFPQRDQLRY
ncbi:MAG: D-cysteine desulfhydrase family protein [Spongiibacteraceae bacterium]